jgi:hypothetical protein
LLFLAKLTPTINDTLRSRGLLSTQSMADTNTGPQTTATSPSCTNS